MTELSYRTPGMTCEGGPVVPQGFHALRVEALLGHGPEVFEAAGRALLGWHMHRRLGIRVPVDTSEASAGVKVALRLGPLAAPCQVIWSVREQGRVGFAYGTLVGHPERGEEAFLIERLSDDSVRFTVWAYSRPAAWYLRAAGPLGRWGQRAVAVGYGRALRRCLRPRAEE